MKVLEIAAYSCYAPVYRSFLRRSGRMTNNFRIGLPEAAGLAIVGGTAGALLGGAAGGQIDMFGLFGAIVGAALPFAIVLLPRMRRHSGG